MGFGEVEPRPLDATVQGQGRKGGGLAAPQTGLTYRQVQMMSKHRDPKTVKRYDHGRENLYQDAVNFIDYDEE